MTLRHVLDIIWRRRLLVLVTMVLVIGFAFLYAVVAPVTFQATATVRYSPAATSTTSGSAGYGSLSLDLDPEFVGTPDIAKAAAETLKTGDAAAIQASVTTNLVEGIRANRLEITTTGSSPAQAEARANAVSKAYVDHLSSQVSQGIETLNKQLEAQQKAQSDALKALSKNANDRLAQQNFNDASTQVTQIQTQITSIQSAGAPATVLQQASGATRTGVSFLTIILVGIGSGIIAGAGIALIREQFDDRLRSTEAIEDVIGGHVLGDVALLSQKEIKQHRLPASAPAPTPFKESIRAVRTSLQVVYPDHRVAIAITSSEPGEGKTFLSANLAVALARAGRSVILVEADLRRPGLSTYFDLPDHAPGLGEALEDDATSETITSYLVPTDFSGLRVLPSGNTQRDPADVLAGDSLGSVIERLRDMADIVLIDTPPGLALADAAILGGEADGMLVVTALNRTRTSALRGTLQILKANKTHIVGVIANRSRRPAVRSYVQYYGAAHRDVPADDADSVESAPSASHEDAPVKDASAPAETAPDSGPADDASHQEAAVSDAGSKTS
jgi:capsular exopolysaccharide synthesis family protein